MSEIGNVPIFSRSESRFREKSRSRTTPAMIGVINAIIYGRLRALRRAFEPAAGIRSGPRKRFRSKPPIAAELSLVLRSARKFQSLRLSVMRTCNARHGAVVSEARGAGRSATRSIRLHILIDDNRYASIFTYRIYDLMRYNLACRRD